MERAMGFEPTTPTLARLCSTPELRPHGLHIAACACTHRDQRRLYGIPAPNARGSFPPASGRLALSTAPTLLALPSPPPTPTRKPQPDVTAGPASSPRHPPSSFSFVAVPLLPSSTVFLSFVAHRAFLLLSSSAGLTGGSSRKGRQPQAPGLVRLPDGFATLRRRTTIRSSVIGLQSSVIGYR